MAQFIGEKALKKDIYMDIFREKIIHGYFQKKKIVHEYFLKNSSW